MTSWSDEYSHLTKLEDLLDKAIADCRKALVRNPTESEARELNSMLVELQKKMTINRDRIDAILAAHKSIRPPSSEQVERVKQLSAEVEAQTNSTMTASATLAFAGKIIALVSSLPGDPVDGGSDV